MEREEWLQQYGRVSGKPAELSQEIFIFKTDCNRDVFNKMEKFSIQKKQSQKILKANG